MNDCDKYLGQKIISYLHSKDACTFSLVNKFFRKQIWSEEQSKIRWDIQGIHFKNLYTSSCYYCDAVSDTAFTTVLKHDKILYICLTCNKKLF